VPQKGQFRTFDQNIMGYSVSDGRIKGHRLNFAISMHMMFEIQLCRFEDLFPLIEQACGTDSNASKPLIYHIRLKPFPLFELAL
jgi:hypothetical protein